MGVKDNSALRSKVDLRRRALDAAGHDPLIVETHGGCGIVWDRVYGPRSRGVVIEKDEERAIVLASQRPQWSVYNGDCTALLEDGLLDHWERQIRIVDIDPYGAAIPVALALFKGCAEALSDDAWIVVNDGARVGLCTRNGWQHAYLKRFVERFGTEGIYDNYMTIVRESLLDAAAAAGFDLVDFAGRYVGPNSSMAHYLARIRRRARSASGAAAATP